MQTYASMEGYLSLSVAQYMSDDIFGMQDWPGWK